MAKIKKQKIPIDRSDYQRRKAAIKQDGIYDFGMGREIVIITPPDSLTVGIAEALDYAAGEHERSFDQKKADADIEKYGLFDRSECYRKDMGQCAYESVIKFNLDKNLWYLVYLLLETGWNDVIDWSTEMREKAIA